VFRDLRAYRGRKERLEYRVRRAIQVHLEALDHRDHRDRGDPQDLRAIRVYRVLQ